MIILNSLRRSLARTFLTSIQSRLSRIYLFFGQINEPTDSPPALDGVDYINYVRNNIFAIKEVLPSDVSFIIPRVDYIADKIYYPYNSSDNSGDYVFNPANFSIYVCVDGGELGETSTEIPSHDTTIPVTLSDGYTWRYVYTIPLYLRDKFLTPQWLPVTNTITESYFSNGGIDSISILDSGEGYSSSNTSIVVSGANGTGSGAIVSPVIRDGKIVSAIIHESGFGYKSPIVMVLSPTATRQAILSTNLSKIDIRSRQALIQSLAVPGTLESIDIISGGTGYTPSVLLELKGDGTGGTFSFVRNNSTGEITNIEITNAGEGYTWAKIVITDDTLIGGSGAEFHVNISTVNGFGRDAIMDLNATAIMIYQNFSRESLNGLPLENTIHRFGLIDNPRTTKGGVYPKDFITEGNFVTSIQTSQLPEYTIGTEIYNEFPVTSNTKIFVVEEQIAGVKNSGIRLRATNGGRIFSDRRYYKNDSVSFVASSASYNLSVDRQMVSACYTLEGTLFDTNIFSVGKILTSNGSRYVIVANSIDKILVSSLDGGVLNNGSSLMDESSNTLEPTNVIPPLLDKKSGSILTIEEPEKTITYGPQQTVSFRTVVKF